MISNYLKITKPLISQKEKINTPFTSRQILFEKLQQINPV